MMTRKPATKPAKEDSMVTAHPLGVVGKVALGIVPKGYTLLVTCHRLQNAHRYTRIRLPARRVISRALTGELYPRLPVFGQCCQPAWFTGPPG
jgi:hypothetical protein